MAIIGTNNLQTILDKAARWAGETQGDTSVVAAANAGLLVANTDVLAALQTAVMGLTDVEQVADLLPSIRDLNDGAPVLHSWAGSVWAAVMRALDTHSQRYGYASLDAYLTYLNSVSPTLRVHGAISLLRAFSPGNVFTSANCVLATAAVTGASTATFTHVAALDTTRYAPGQIKVLNTKGEGLTSTVLTFPGAIKNGVATSINATVTVTTNATLTVFSDANLAFTDCPIAGATISGGNAGDTFSIVIVPDRSVSAA
jgi:hypothetical protein